MLLVLQSTPYAWCTGKNIQGHFSVDDLFPCRDWKRHTKKPWCFRAPLSPSNSICDVLALGATTLIRADASSSIWMWQGGQWFMNGGLRDVQVFMAGTCQICDKWQPNRWWLKKQIWFVLKRVYWGPCQQRHQRHVSCPILDLEAQWCRNWSAPRKTHK